MKDKHHGQGHQNDAASDPHRSGAPSSHNTTPRQHSHAGNAASESHSDENNAKDRQFRKVNMILTLVFTGALVLVTTIYAWFAGGQWQAMDASLKEMRQNRELEYRAYVGAKGVMLQQRTDNPAFADVTLLSMNTGRTPVQGGGQIVKMIEARDSSPPDDMVIKSEGLGSKTAYIPNMDYSSYMGVIPTRVADALIQKAQAVANSEPTPPEAKVSPTPQAPVPTLKVPEMPEFGRGWYVYGVIDYQDIFGKPHRTRFCFFARPGTKEFALCPTFNDSN